MQIIIMKKEKLYKHPFPNEYISNYWLKDSDEFGNERDLIMLEKQADSWILISNDICKIYNNNQEVPSIALNINQTYLVKIIGKRNITNALIYVYNENDASYTSYQVTGDGEYTIGSSRAANIIMTANNISGEHAILTKENNKFSIKSKDDNVGLYINDYKEVSKVLDNGDTIFIMGYKIIVMNDYLIINGYINGLQINSRNIVRKDLPQYSGEYMATVDDDNAEL